MTHRPHAMLMIVLIAVNAICGGVFAGASLCFGSGHEHEHAATEQACEHACGHDTGLIALDSAGSSDDFCGCADVELVVAEHVSVPSNEVQPVPLPAPFILVSLDTPVVPHTARVTRDRLAGDDPGGGRSVAVLACTRLIL